MIVDSGKLAGMVSIAMLRYLPRGDWDNTRLGRVMRQNTASVHPDELVEDALQRMIEDSLTALPVVERENRRIHRLHFQQ